MTLAAAERVLLATKLHPPMPRRLMPRPRLVARLRLAERRLTVLDAPAGWGKTSLLAQWLAAPDPGVRVAWLACDSGDNDPVLFWSYVVAALRTQVPGVGRAALSALGAGSRAVREAAIPSLVNDLLALPNPLVLVLDDYHAITDAEVHATVALLLDRLPPQLHVVVATRGDPPLPLGRLRVAGELLELRTDDLAFDDEEVGLVLGAVPGVELSDQDVARLARRVEGWPAGVSLAAASLAGRPHTIAEFVDAFTGTDRYVLDYLYNEVIAQLPPDLCAFVLRTSILRRFCPSLCEAVTQRPDAAAVLDHIERAGVFLVTLDAEREWFRYHRLFGELLRHQLSLAEPELIPELHRRAAAWSAEHGAITDAVRHRVSARDVHEAAELVATNWNEWFNEGRLATVGGWLDRLPPAVVRADPRLCAARAWLLLDLGRLDEVDAWISAGDAAAGPADLGALRDLAVLRSVHRFKIGDLEAARTAARRVLELGDGEVCFAATVAHLMTGITAFWSGDPGSARRPLAEAVRLARRTSNTLAETYALGYLALVAADGRALDEAARAMPLAMEKPTTDPRVAEHFVSSLPHLATAMLLTATGRTEAAARASDRAVALARRGAGRLELALALAVRAQTLGAIGGDGQLLLEQARELARGAPSPGLLPLRLARLRIGHPPVAPRSHVPVAPRGGVALSDRERELLPLLAGTLSQREIGGVLHLSLNTVKTHSRVLFRKLGVSSRAQAVTRARELGLL